MHLGAIVGTTFWRVLWWPNDRTRAPRRSQMRRSSAESAVVVLTMAMWQKSKEGESEKESRVVSVGSRISLGGS